MFDVSWVFFGVVVLGGVFWPQVSIVCVCARGLVHLVYLIIIIYSIFIYCSWVVTRWQWLFYM